MGVVVVIDPDEAAGRGARLVEKIEETLGEDWLDMPDFKGREKRFAVRVDNHVALVVGNDMIFYPRPSDGELLCLVYGGGRWAEGSWVTGEFDIHAVGPLADPDQN